LAYASAATMLLQDKAEGYFGNTWEEARRLCGKNQLFGTKKKLAQSYRKTLSAQ
jgi:hypothetical protein